MVTIIGRSREAKVMYKFKDQNLNSNEDKKLSANSE
jgi:hypothetical protein